MRLQRSLTGAVLALAVTGLALGGEVRAQGSVQGVPNAMQGFSQNRDKPIQIDAGSLELRDKEKAATFKDNVKVVQGDTTMRCKILVVFYEGGAGGSATSGAQSNAQPAQPKPTMTSATPGPTGSSAIKRLEAKGGVIVTQKDQTVTGDNGVFDMKTNTITVTGNVVLTQGDNILRGDTLIVDMTTGISRVEAKKGVQGMFKSSAPTNPGAGGLFPSSPPQPSAPAPRQSGKPLKLNDVNEGTRR
ncbi:LptA/OstA family protein [Bradyrhizobium sp. WD16]|uniref:LptA/OstA family protein n=1 Tax=Bradyrhizobium sp. WD16 TaxID=1521768 RepID=UPI0020A2833C|nr:LptA/OstA family protein [Bradyrhizobium sp. WD16]UTD30266.1 LPS ABC transporter substrate-binding protein LptA [Bradyrhizobium sp. WD16]